MTISANSVYSPTDARQLQNYNDLNSLQSLKVDHGNKADRIDAVAKQFESMFVSLLLKSMRSANDVFTKDNPLNSQQVKFYQDMYDSQLAVSLSSTRGIGLAEVIKQQLSNQGVVPSGRSASEDLKLPGDNQGFSIDAYQRVDFGLNSVKAPVSIEQVNETLSVVQGVLQKSDLTDQSAVTGNVSNQDKGDTVRHPVDFSSPEKYVESLLPYAQRVEAETGIDARLMLAQSALETGWGQHQILKQDGQPSFNLFGIKSNNGWGGQSAEITTTEYRSGVAMKERAEFRAYDSYEQSFRDYAEFLQTNQRYSEALTHREDPVQFAHALQKSGYATDPNYGNKIESILDRLWLPEDSASQSNAGISAQ